MRRLSVTIPDELDAEIERYRSQQPVPPSTAALVQHALGEFLSRHSRPAQSTLERVLRHRHDIKRLATEHHAADVRLFGSTARGTAGAGSDIDLLVTVSDTATLFDLARLSSALEALLDAPVDVVSDSGMTEAESEAVGRYAIAL
ncbi:nucleotidyltransferase family protein [Candidatus Poriferisodalis sp.]|uniref:nucleotidyltransferase family protein n=1 Tax=Candidatus Poriferisodalis sp. TaxID=3101277 RepID=UPI003B020BED